MRALCWLSFADPHRPKGRQFLGACIVEMGMTGNRRADLREALMNAWKLRCNPGGSVAFQPVPPTMEPHIPAKWIGRLLTRADCDEFDREMKPYGVS